jgi:hypothetical protein
VEQSGQCCQNLAGVHNLDRLYQAEWTLLVVEERFLALPLNPGLDGQRIAVMSTHLSIRIDCTALVPESIAPVLAEAMEVVDVEDNACRWT